MTHLELANFRSYRKAALALDNHVTFVVGVNGSGKSSLIDAIEWALTGTCRGLDARGAGVDTLIRAADGKAEAGGLQVRLAIDGLGDATRTATGKSTSLQVGEFSGPSNVQAGLLFDRLQTTPAIVHALLDTGAFLALHHKDAKDLLLQVLDVRVPVDGQSLTLAQVEARYSKAFDERRAKKAEVAAIHVPDAPEGEAPDVAALDRQLAGLRDEEKKLITQEAQAAGQQTGRRSGLNAERGRLDAKQLTLRTAVRAHPDDLDAQLTALEERLAIQEDGGSKGDDQAFQRARLTVVDAEGRLKLVTDAVDGIRDHDPQRGCILDGSIPCKTPVKAFRDQVGKLEAQIAELTKTQEQARQVVAERQKAEIDRREQQERLLALKGSIRARDADRQALKEVEARLVAIDEELASLPAAAAPAGPSPALEAVKGRIAKGETVIQEARAFVQQGAAHDAQAAKWRQAQTELARLEQLVDLLGPKGARVKALEGAVTDFEQAINEALARFGYELRFQLEPWTVVVNGLPSDLLSTSERLRIGVALQLALADVTGVGFVAIDQADLLDGDGRAALTELLLAWQGGQAIVCATKDADFEAPAIDGMTVYRLSRGEDGWTAIERCDATVAA